MNEFPGTGALSHCFLCNFQVSSHLLSTWVYFQQIMAKVHILYVQYNIMIISVQSLMNKIKYLNTTHNTVFLWYKKYIEFLQANKIAFALLLEYQFLKGMCHEIRLGWKWYHWIGLDVYNSRWAYNFCEKWLLTLIIFLKWS